MTDDRMHVTKDWAEANGFVSKDSEKRYWGWVAATDPRHDSRKFVLELEFAPSLEGAAALSLLSIGGGFGNVFLISKCERGYIRRLCEAIHLPWKEQTK